MRSLVLSVAALAACSRPQAIDAGPEAPAATAQLPDAAVAVEPPAARGAPKSELEILFGKLPRVFESSANPVTAAKVELGRMLYFEARLSRSQNISCDSCHALGRFGVDGQAVSEGIAGQKERRNTPTTLNVAGQQLLGWDGSAPDVEAVAKFHLLNASEMGMDEGRL